MKIRLRYAVVVSALALLAACGKKEEAVSTAPAAPAVPAEEKVLNVYNWTNYIGETTIADFEKETGIKVRYDNYDSNETLEAKLLTGSSDYDVVVPTANFLERQIKAGVYQKLDKTKLTNLGNMDPDIMKRLQLHDPGNEHAVDYMWGMTGIGYNATKVKKLLPNAPTDSWRLVFDPAIAKALKPCGIAILDSASEMTYMTLAYLGKDPNSQNPEDLKLVEAALMKIRPFVKYVDSSRYIDDLAAGEICVAVGYNGDILQARATAIESKSGADIKFVAPKEGTIIWFDTLAIPKAAPHPNNAHLFIDYMMRPESIAAVSDLKKYANGNTAATSHVAEAVRNDPGIYPPAEVRARLFPNLASSDEFTRLQTGLWRKFTQGQ
jgi:putrescine transport system substrate-binding protein